MKTIATPQVGRFEYGIAFADWRFDGEQVTNRYPLSVSSPVMTSRGLRIVLPYRAQSFTVGKSIVTPAGQIVNGQSSSLASVTGCKAFELSNETGTAEQAEDELILPGPMAGGFTSSGFHESGFNVAPEAPFLVEQDDDGVNALTVKGTYQVVVTYISIDENGDRVFSAPSPPLNVTMTGANNVAVYGGRLPTPLNSDGNPIPFVVGPNNRQTTIQITRTSYRGDIPTTEHYVITDPLNANGKAPVTTTNGSGFSFPDDATWNYRDENADVSILTSETLYTDRGLLPRFPAPANRGGVHWKNREWLVGYDGAVWFSGERTQGDAAWFFPLFRFNFEQYKPQCLAAMDDYLIVICESSVWYIPSATFPDATGRNGTLPTPVRLPFNNGGTGFAVTIRAGAAYSSTAGGVWLITRGLENKWLSESIDDSLSIPITGMAVDKKQRLHVATGTSGWFVWDQVSGCWYRWALPSGTASLPAILDGEVAWQDDNRVAVYAPGTFADVIGADTFGVPPGIRLASLQFAAVRNMIRLWEAQLIGVYKGPHNVTAIMAYPGNNPDAPPTTFGPYTPDPALPYVYPINPKLEESPSFEVEFNVDFDGVDVPGNSAEWELLSCEVGVDTGAGLVKTRARIIATE